VGEVAIGMGCAIAFSALHAQARSLGGDAISTVSSGEIDLAQITIFQAIVLGFVQGMTEFIPISSTAHLKVVPVMLGWGDPGITFTAIIQLGSIGAVLWYFWADLSELATGTIQALQKRDFQSQAWRISLGIAIGTVPIVVFGLLLKALVPNLDDSPIRSLPSIAIASIVMAILLAVSEKVGQHRRTFETLSTSDGIWMGLAQALALMPGVSRSGSTLTAGLFMGLERATAARFSFLLGIPAITLAGLVQLKSDVIDVGVPNAAWLSLIVGTLSAAFFSYLAIAWLIKFLQKQDTWVFVWYRLIFGVVILGALGMGWL
jgi:undecaprenyl-diphosphatase